MLTRVPKQDLKNPVRFYAVHESDNLGEADHGVYYDSTVEKFLNFALHGSSNWMREHKVLWIHCVIELSTGEVAVAQWSKPTDWVRGGWQFTIPLTTWYYQWR